jgi:light-harvesting protein B-800-850 alpha chain
MNQGRIWCVVSPTVGLPLFLGSVAVTSLIVHGCILTHTNWMSNYWAGSKARVALNTSSSQTTLASPTGSPVSVTVTQVPATSTVPASFVITVAPATGNTGKAAVTTASAAPVHTGAALRTASVN